MDLYDELKTRGLVAQVINEQKVRDLLNAEKTVFYIGFDPTANSLHAGHFVQVMLIAYMQRAGHFPIVLFGGGTGFVGDPTGKNEMRRMMTSEEVAYNISCLKKQMAFLVDFSEDRAIILDNSQWLRNLNYIDFLREIGVHFSVNRMLAAESYKQRMETGLSLFEMNYMVMQSYDFLVLNRKYNCKLQLGGNDQWGNIIGGVELIRRVDKKEAFAMTSNLLLTSDGRKMGKTEKGALWLDPEKTSPYEFYQYWRNVNDADVVTCLKMLTFLPLNEIEELGKLQHRELNRAKEILAFEVTKSVHGEEEATKAKNTAAALFGRTCNNENMPSKLISRKDFKQGEISILDVISNAELAGSKSEARRLIEQGGITVDGQKVQSVDCKLSENDFGKGYVVIRKGKKVYCKVTIE